MFLIIFILWNNIPNCQNVIVNTSKGSVLGYHVNYGEKSNNSLYHGQADIFQGIPFANPPQRFQVRCEKFLIQPKKI